ncbi:MAG: SBBP repeat-containing protein [Saprospiraceae bacterium]
MQTYLNLNKAAFIVINVFLKPSTVFWISILTLSLIHVSFCQTNLEWSTYHGGISADAFRDLTIDQSGFLYAIGSTTSDNQIATTNASQSSKSGGSDAFVAKYNQDGQLIWSTYVGGNGDDYGQAITIDRNGFVIITGLTFSDREISTSGVHQQNYGGGGDAFIAKMTADGNLVWQSYFGGEAFDFANDVETDQAGNILCTGWTMSTTQIASTNALRSINAGNEDIFIAKFDPAGQRTWSTYYGGSEAERGLQIGVDINNSIIISGWVQSPDQFNTPDAHQPNYGGGTSDNFILKLSESGLLQWATYYGGTANEYIDAMYVNEAGEIFVAGASDSDAGIAAAGAFQVARSGDFDIFVGKFSASGVRQWATYYGGEGIENVYKLIQKPNNDLVLTGFTNSNEMATPDSYQANIQGGFDIILANFGESGQLQNAIYFGGPQDDFGYGVVTDRSDNIYIVGYTNGSTNLSTTGAHQMAYGGNPQDGVIAKFATCTPFDIAIAGNFVLCQGEDISLSVTPYTNAIWRGPNGFMSNLPTIVIPEITSQNAGTYTVTVTNQHGCTATSSQTIMVNRLPIAIASSNSPVCNGSDIMIQVSGGTSYQWEGPQDFHSVVQNPVISSSTLSMAGLYTVTVTDQNGCSQITTSNVLVLTGENVEIFSNSPVCAGDTLTLDASAGQGFIWNGPNAFFSREAMPKIATTTSAHSGNYTLTVTHQNGCSAMINVSVAIKDKPIAQIEGDTAICQGESLVLNTSNIGNVIWSTGSTNKMIEISPLLSTEYQLIVNENNCIDTAYHVVLVNPLPQLLLTSDHSEVSSGETTRLHVVGADDYQWSSHNDLSCFSCAEPIATPLETQTYCVRGETNGCSAEECITITIKDLCKMDLPNIISPNGDQLNDVWCSLEKDCISSQHLQIYDRWGNLHYTTSGAEVCWNPIISNPNLQPQVLTYLLRTTSKNHQEEYFTGTVTLIK